MPKKAAIDIGSNSVLLLIAEINNDSLETLESISTITSLGRELDITKNFHEESMKDTYQTLKRYQARAAEFGIKAEDIIITATEASRVAQNANKFYTDIERDTGLKVNIITGKAEAYFSTMGVSSDPTITDREIILMDIGGASTEFIKYQSQNKNIISSISTPVGVVRATEWKKNNDLSRIFDQKLIAYSEYFKDFNTQKLICVAGTMTSMANMHLNNQSFDEKNISGMKLTFEDLTQLFEKYNTLSEAEILEIFPFLGKRVRTIKAGMELALYFCRRLGVQNLHISTYGLRHGTILVDKINPEFIHDGTN